MSCEFSTDLKPGTRYEYSVRYRLNIDGSESSIMGGVYPTREAAEKNALMSNAAETEIVRRIVCDWESVGPPRLS